MSGAARTDHAGVLASAAAGDMDAFANIVATYDDETYRVCVAVCRTTFRSSVRTTRWAALRSIHRPFLRLAKSRIRSVCGPQPFTNDGGQPGDNRADDDAGETPRSFRGFDAPDPTEAKWYRSGTLSTFAPALSVEPGDPA